MDLAGLEVGIRIAGDCMVPWLADGDRVKVVRCRRYWPGDILVVAPGNGRPPYAHRLIGIYRRKGTWRYLTQADRAPRPDGFVTRERILGKVCTHAPSLRHRLWAVGRFLRHLGRRLLG
ncbi:MAG: hypothetical protein D6819_09330 [Gammaproteobacteria bacterium]|nr:MAG: hypothetical protein D6819_09330 [Gammaproteobacteria bacterium]